ncbi:hypothetical protein DFJ74DRAFT_247055 [Hyaloraphidium curvatum]|nr:hypothetical protein DFJ74DRAFT_247055 [Hyaloraphidium curvatum]
MPSRSKGKQTSPQSPRLAWRVGQSSLIKARPRTDAPRRRSCGTSKATACARAPLQRAPAAWRAAAAGLGCYCCLPAHPCGNFSSTTFSYRGFFCFGSYTWSQRWLATIFSLQILFGLLSNYVGAWKCFDGGVGQIFLRPYVRRLRRRAIKDALDGMLDRHSRALEEERAGKSRSPGDFAVAEAYEVLQSHLSPLWEASANSRDFTSFIFFHTFLGVVFGLLYLATGRCIPGAVLGPFLFHVATFIFAVGSASSANASVSDARHLYLAAQYRLRTLLARHGPFPSAAADSLRAHDALVGACIAQADASGMKLFGVTVGPSAVRVTVVTLFTILLGLWNIIRGLGGFLTIETMCPSVG